MNWKNNTIPADLNMSFYMFKKQVIYCVLNILDDASIVAIGANFGAIGTINCHLYTVAKFFELGFRKVHLTALAEQSWKSCSPHLYDFHILESFSNSSISAL